MPKINQEEYRILKDLDDKWKWIARDDMNDLFYHGAKPVKRYSPSQLHWDNFANDFKYVGSNNLFQFIQWEDEEPYNITELIDEYEDDAETNPFTFIHNENEETEVEFNIGDKVFVDNENFFEKDKIYTIKKFGTEHNEYSIQFEETSYVALEKHLTLAKEGTEVRECDSRRKQLDDLNALSGLSKRVKKLSNVVDQLERPKPTLQDVTARLWELPIHDRKQWLEQLNNEFKEGYIVPLGLQTSNGEEQFLTYKGNYFASKKNKHLKQKFDTLEEIPEFYRDLAERVL